MRRKLGVLCLLLGFCCLLSSAAVLIFNRHEETRAESASEELLQDVREIISVSRLEESGSDERADEAIVPEAPEVIEMLVEDPSQETVVIPDVEEILPEIPTVLAEADIPPEMPTTQVDGYDCIGVLSIPVLDLELPVLNDWSYEKLKTAPCCYYGTYYDPDFVIAAHNYRSHFGRLSELQAEDLILFTDISGTLYCYEVVLLETLPGNATKEMITSGFDLSLYTCTAGGGSRITVRCSTVRK